MWSRPPPRQPLPRHSTGYSRTRPRAPVYPFGHGLSYTSFRYGKRSIDPVSGGIENGLTATVEVTNTGDRAGDEVAQAYITPLGFEGATRPRAGVADPARDEADHHRLVAARRELRHGRRRSPAYPRCVSTDRGIGAASGRHSRNICAVDRTQEDRFAQVTFSLPNSRRK